MPQSHFEACGIFDIWFDIRLISGYEQATKRIGIANIRLT